MTTFPLRIIRCYGDNLNTINQKQLMLGANFSERRAQLLLIFFEANYLLMGVHSSF